jgi:hypothetical protein
MNTVLIGAATSSSSTITFCAASAAIRVRQWTGSAASACAAAGRHIALAVSDRRAALGHRLQEFVLELLAAIVLIAIFLIVTDPATRNDPDVGDSGVRSNP